MESWSFCNFYFKSASFISRSKSETNTKRKTEIPLELDSRCSCIISPAMANDSLCTHWLANDHQLIKQQLSHRSLKNPQDNKMKTPSCFYSYPTKCRWTCCVSSKVSKKSPFWDIIYSQILMEWMWGWSDGDEWFFKYYPNLIPFHLASSLNTDALRGYILTFWRPTRTLTLKNGPRPRFTIG